MGCIFCMIANGEKPSLRVYEDEHAIAFFDMMQATPGHTLVVPKKHYADIFSIPAQDFAHLGSAIQLTAQALKDRLGCDGVNIINASGEAAQQSVFHLHFHILPRTKDDGVDAWIKTPAAGPIDRDEVYRRFKGG
jgi:histidine triad (HIT) family protein